ncbi:ribonuclease H-like domain-containing protein [Tanacetum coccineum]|uniref:Ribonuclease H-like domain-containing protein n=1 Tax=Tanacetum coccineum TaxID=301880 RepID=A0ABQ5GT12_9ASTR
MKDPSIRGGAKFGQGSFFYYLGDGVDIRFSEMKTLPIALQGEFDKTDLGAVNYVMGNSVTHNSLGKFVSHKNYALELLELAHMRNCNPTRTPMDIEPKLSPEGILVSVRRLLSPEHIWELHTPLLYASLVYCDSVIVVYLSATPVQHWREKHINIDINYVCDMVATWQVLVLHVSSRYQYANIFTKGLPSCHTPPRRKHEA